MKNILVLFLLIISVNLYSQNLFYNSEKFNNLYNNLLTTHELSVRDIFIPESYKQEIKYELLLYKDLLKYPPSSNLLTEKLALNLKNNSLNKENLADICSKISVKPFQMIEYDDFLANDFINKMLGINLDSTFSFPASLIIKQYLIPILKVYKSLENDFILSNKPEVRFLKKYADSLLFVEKTEIHNPYQYHHFQKNNTEIARNFFNYSDGFKQSNVINYGYSLYSHFDKVNQITLDNIDDLKSQVKTVIVETNLGKIAIGGTGDDSYSGNFLLIIDLGGNDTYNIESVSKELLSLSPVHVIIDLSGDDNYKAGDFSLGCGYFGINILMDLAGKDKYNAGNYSLGAAIFGFGILHDFDGDDLYVGKNFTQGAAFFGFGFLLDDKGKDEFRAGSFSQGFATTAGFGILIDKFGDDKYTSNSFMKKSAIESNNSVSFSQGASLGYEALAAGGIGLLIDLSGNDKYIADSYSQAVAINYGIAGLYDFEGNDEYNCRDFGQSFAANFSMSNFYDYIGNDKYSSGISTLASSYSYSYSSLFDISGDDSFFNSEKVFVKQNPAISLFIKTSGKANYKGYCSLNKDRKFSFNTQNSSYNLVINDINNLVNDDLEHPSEDYSNLSFKLFNLPLMNIEFKNSEKNFLLPSSIDSLAVIAISPLENFKKFASSAKDSLAKYSISDMIAIENVIDLSDKHNLSVYEFIINKIISRKEKNDFSELTKLINTENQYTFGVYSRVMTRHYPEESKLYITLRFTDKNPQIREAAITSLGRINNIAVAENISGYLNDRDISVRCAAAITLGMMKQPGYLEALNQSFEDGLFAIRDAAYKGIVSNLSPDFLFVESLLSDKISSAMKTKLIPLILKADLNDKEFREFLKLFKSQDSSIKAIFYSELSNNNSKQWTKRHKQIIKNEKDNELIKLLKHE